MAACADDVDAFVKSPFLLSQAVVEHMKGQSWGRIINIGSEVLNDGAPQFSAYVAMVAKTA